MMFMKKFCTLTFETFNLNFSKLAFLVTKKLPQLIFARGFELLTSFFQQTFLVFISAERVIYFLANLN